MCTSYSLRLVVSPTVRFIAGGDYLFGEGSAHGANFDYDAPLDGAFAPVVPPTDLQIEDHRNFVGGYSMLEWRPTSRLRVDGGVRLNVTSEVREGGERATKSGKVKSRATRMSARAAARG